MTFTKKKKKKKKKRKEVCYPIINLLEGIKYYAPNKF